MTERVIPEPATDPTALALPQASGPEPVTTVPAASTSLAKTPGAADDGDTIEPEWVAVIKNTMVTYRHDPYALAQAMTEVRDDYLTKRYERNIKPETPNA